jgi:hypothetical protein
LSLTPFVVIGILARFHFEGLVLLENPENCVAKDGKVKVLSLVRINLREREGVPVYS